MAEPPSEPRRRPGKDAPNREDALEAMEHELLSRVAPKGIFDEDGGWQRRKSAQTRIAILEAALKCLAEIGYARTTTKVVADAAGVSRGAMLHHYPTKRGLVEQAAAYAFFKRMQRNFAEFRKLTEKERADELAGVMLHWKNLHTLEYRAYLELCIAARTDKELRGILDPIAARFDEIQLTEFPKVYPGWAGIPRQLTLANDLMVALMDGLLLNHMRWQGPDRAENVRKLLARMLFMLRTRQIDAGNL